MQVIQIHDDIDSRHSEFITQMKKSNAFNSILQTVFAKMTHCHTTTFSISGRQDRRSRYVRLSASLGRLYPSSSSAAGWSGIKHGQWKPSVTFVAIKLR